jgi:sortase A
MKLRVVVPPTRRAARTFLLLNAYQIYESWQFDHETTDQPEPAREPRPAALPVLLPDPDHAAPRSIGAPSDGVVGRILIPRLHLSAIVEEGIDDTTLSRAVGHIPGTALPGETGNMGIAGHRDTFFRALKDLERNDKIDFMTHTAHFHYVVDSLTVVEPNDVGVLSSDGGHTLTIVTCFPFHYIGNAPRRFIVHAISR